jgi:serine/threonine protein kinase
MASDMPNEGDVIAGRYDLLAHLGDGGTASVWKAHDRTLQRDVAIKFLYVVDERAIEDMRKQFLREARIACAVKHRNVIQTMDFGQTAEGRAYMVMELLHGEEISDRLGRQPPLELPEIIKTISGVLRGLQAIHDAGIVHRDLKPENVYLEQDEDGVYPKILDFGIAKSVDRRSGSRRSVLTTKEGLIVGTPEYMSPEQARGHRDLDGRSDVWSVGVILFELLTRVLPFDAPSEADVIIKVVTTDAPRLREFRPDIPDAIDELVAKALSRDRTQRFQSANEMLQALALAERSIEAERSGQAPRHRRYRSALWVLAIGAVAVIAMIALPARPSVDSARPGASASSTVTVELRGVPETASVLVNGKPATGNKLVLADDGYARLIEVQAAGMQPWRVMHPAGNNARYEVRMQALPQPQDMLPANIAGGAPNSDADTASLRDASLRKRAEPIKRTPKARPAQPPATAPTREPDRETPPPLWRDLDF